MFKTATKIIAPQPFSNPFAVKSQLPNPNLTSKELAIKTKEEQVMPKLAAWSFLESLSELPKVFSNMFKSKAEIMQKAFSPVAAEQGLKYAENAKFDNWRDWTLHNIAARESNFNSKVRGLPIKNGEMAMGMFQFMPSTAKSLGYADQAAFLNNPKMQYEAAVKNFDQGLSAAKNYGVNIDFKKNPMEAAKHMYGYWYGGGGYFKNLKNNPAYLNTTNYAGGKKMPSLVQAVTKFEKLAVPYQEGFKSPHFNFK